VDCSWRSRSSAASRCACSSASSASSKRKSAVQACPRERARHARAAIRPAGPVRLAPEQLQHLVRGAPAPEQRRHALLGDELELRPADHSGRVDALAEGGLGRVGTAEGLEVLCGQQHEVDGGDGRRRGPGELERAPGAFEERRADAGRPRRAQVLARAAQLHLAGTGRPAWYAEGRTRDRPGRRCGREAHRYNPRQPFPPGARRRGRAPSPANALRPVKGRLPWREDRGLMALRCSRTPRRVA